MVPAVIVLVRNGAPGLNGQAPEVADEAMVSRRVANLRVTTRSRRTVLGPLASPRHEMIADVDQFDVRIGVTKAAGIAVRCRFPRPLPRVEPIGRPSSGSGYRREWSYRTERHSCRAVSGCSQHGDHAEIPRRAIDRHVTRADIDRRGAMHDHVADRIDDVAGRIRGDIECVTSIRRGRSARSLHCRRSVVIDRQGAGRDLACRDGARSAGSNATAHRDGYRACAASIKLLLSNPRRPRRDGGDCGGIVRDEADVAVIRSMFALTLMLRPAWNVDCRRRRRRIVHDDRACDRDVVVGLQNDGGAAIGNAVMTDGCNDAVGRRYW